MDTASREKLERDGLEEIKTLITEFLKSGEGSAAVREYISSVSQDDSKLLVYLKGRKYRPNHAWETLFRYAKVRFNEYPELFPATVPESFLTIFKTGVVGLLKNRDHFGRRTFDLIYAQKWEPRELSMEQITATVALFVDRLLTDEDMMNNGTQLHRIRNEAFESNLARWDIATAKHILFKLKAIYYLNVPSYALYLHKLVKPFLSRKLKERFIVSTTDRQFEVLHENISPKLLPKLLGGVCENDEVTDWDLLYHL